MKTLVERLRQQAKNKVQGDRSRRLLLEAATALETSAAPEVAPTKMVCVGDCRWYLFMSNGTIWLSEDGVWSRLEPQSGSTE